MSLELACEMLWVVEPKLFGYLRNLHATDEKLLGTLHDEPPNHVRGGIARQLADEIAEVIGRQEQLLCTIANGGQAVNSLQMFTVVAHEQILEACEQVGMVFGRRRELLFVESGDILQHQSNAMHQDMAGVLVVVGSFAAYLLQQRDDGLPLTVGHVECFVDVIGEIGVGGHATFEVGSMQQLGIEEQRPALGLYLLACVGLAAYLSRGHAHQGVAVQVVGSQPIGEFLERFVADEHAEDVVVVERVAAVLQLVVMNHRDERMQLRRTDVACVVVDAVYLQYLIHHIGLSSE